MSDMYISVNPTSSWHHTNCWTLVNSSSHWSGCLPHNKTLLQEDISNKSPSKGDNVHEQVEGPSTYEDIAMTESLAYVSVNQKYRRKGFGVCGVTDSRTRLYVTVGLL